MKSVKRATKASASGKDAVALLKADHRKVEGLFRKAQKASGGAKEKLVQQICNELIIHTTLEEEIFYPACLSEDVAEDKMDEAQVEHDGAKFLINDLKNAKADSAMYDAKTKVLSEYIKHHVKEEEKPRTGVFADAKRKGVDMIEIGAQIASRKKELMAQAEDGTLPAPEPKAVDGGAKRGSKRPQPEAERASGGTLRNLAAAAKRATFGE